MYVHTITFIVALCKVTLSHRNPAFAGTSCDSVRTQRHTKRDKQRKEETDPIEIWRYIILLYCTVLMFVKK
jgi:hypothetical protein